MKANKVTVIVVSLLAIAGIALAGPWGRGGGITQGTPVNLEEVKKFQDETTAFRNEMMLKKAELRNEYLKQPVDTSKVAKITEEMTALQTKITASAASHGLPGAGNGCGMGKGMGRGIGMGMGREMGRMQAANHNR